MWSGWDCFVCHVINYNIPNFLSITLTVLSFLAQNHNMAAKPTWALSRKGSDVCRRSTDLRGSKPCGGSAQALVTGQGNTLVEKWLAMSLGQAWAPNSWIFTTLTWAPLARSYHQDVTTGPSKQWTWKWGYFRKWNIKKGSIRELNVAQARRQQSQPELLSTPLRGRKMLKKVGNNQTSDGGSKWRVPLLTIPKKKNQPGLVQQGGCRWEDSRGSAPRRLPSRSPLFAPERRRPNITHLTPLVYSRATPSTRYNRLLSWIHTFILKQNERKNFQERRSVGRAGINKTPSWKSFQWKVENKRNVRKQAGKQKTSTMKIKDKIRWHI